MVWHRVVRGVARRGEAERWRNERKCGGVCVRRAWLCLAVRACVGGVRWRRLAGSDIGCGGGVAWVRLRVDVDGGGEGGGSRVKGKEKKDSWLDE